MFSSRSFGFSPGSDPWFRVGTVDVTTMMIVAGIIIVSMIVRAIEGSSAALTGWLEFDQSAIESGQIWRLVTWFIPNDPSLWLIISAVIIAGLGGRIENALGRKRTVFYLGYLLVLGALLALVLSWIWQPTFIFLTGQPGSTISSFVILAFVCYLPNVRFFFGIPGWVLVGVFAFITVLQLGQIRRLSELVWYLAAMAMVMLLTRAFGLADQLEWIPRVPVPEALGGVPRPGKSGGGRSRRPSGPSLDDPIEQMEIDAILDQVSEKGIQSLSRSQKRKLKAHSNKRKGRRS